MTQTRLAGINACDPFSAVRARFPSARDTLTPTESEELFQAGMIVDLAPTQGLFFGASWLDSTTVTLLSTTSPIYRTRRGLHVGSSFAEVLATGDSVELGFAEGVLVAFLLPDRISFMVDEGSAHTFYTRYEAAGMVASPAMMDSSARIIELFGGSSCGR